MKKIADTLVVVFATFIVTMLMDTAAGLLTQARGTAIIGPSVTIQGQVYVPVDLSNFTGELVDGVMLSIPTSMTISDTVSSSPIQMEVVPDAAGISSLKRIRISGLEPYRLTRLLIPVVSQSEVGTVQILNAKQMKLDLEEVEGIRNPVQLVLLGALTPALIYALLVGVAFFWIQTQNQDNIVKIKKQAEDNASKLEKDIQETRKQSAELEKRVDEAESELLESRKKFEEYEKDYYRSKVLLRARLNDYAKELSFWRDTIRKTLYQSIHHDKAAELVINQVTETLKTYGTRSNVTDDFEAIKVMAGILARSERDQRDTE
jgi:hypothetical protein